MWTLKSSTEAFTTHNTFWMWSRWESEAKNNLSVSLSEIHLRLFLYSYQAVAFPTPELWIY